MKSLDVLPTWYWPDGVPRYVSLPRTARLYPSLVGRWARREPGRVALRTREEVLEYGMLDRRAGSVAAALSRTVPHAPPRVVVALRRPAEAALVLIAAIRLGSAVLVLDPDLEPPAAKRAVDLFRGDVVVSDGGGPGAAPAARVDVRHLLDSATDGPPGPSGGGDAPAGAATVTLVSGDGLVSHPEAGLLGWAAGFRAFTELQREELVILARPLQSWEGLTGLVATLSTGGTTELVSASDDLADLPERPGPSRLWIDGADAALLLEQPRLLDRMAGVCGAVYVSVNGAFSPRMKRILRRRVRSDVLTIWGTAVTGPIAASARAWQIDEAIGIAFTGVDLLPVDPGRNRLADPPWPLLAWAGIGVQSQFVLPETGLAADVTGRFVSDSVFFPGATGRLDANGMLYLL